jgi:hypothetical protein
MIFTLKSDGTRIPFRWASLSATQQSAIGNTTIGPKILDFVRGDRTNEMPNGSKFRARKSVLGDIIHSRPYYVEGTPFSTVYVGSNDGMLHAIDAQTGNERYAYVPSMLISKLSSLAPIDPTPYMHTWFVDATPNSVIASISGTNKRILVGGLGAGGKGLYALDISADATTTPTIETGAASKILWEITDSSINNAASTSYSNLGYTYGIPVIAAVNSSTQSAVIIGNGYMNSGNGRAILYVIDAGTGSLMRAIDTGSGSTANPNGLSSPTAIDINGDGKIDYVYAGDIDGNLWKFDLTSPSAASWSVIKLFTTSPAQAITGAPAVSSHPNGGFMIAFGTGRTLTASDLSDTAVFYAYAIRDGAPGTTNALLSQTLSAATYTYGTGSIRVRTITSNIPDWTVHYGWKVPLPSGERIIGDGMFIANGRFYFNSYNPTVNTVTEPTGENWLHELDYLTGGSRTTPFLDLNGDLLVNDLDRVKNGSGVVIAGSAGVPVAKFLGSGISSQPILVQLSSLNTTLFNSNPNLTIAPAYGGRGVIGGHFDVDIFYPTCVTKNGVSTCNFQLQKHFHQYDKVFNVIGVDFLNASSTTLNLVNAIPNASTQFKILLMNQYLNPAVSVNVGNAGYTVVKNYGILAKEISAATLLASLPTYTRGSIGTLTLKMPLDAFTPLNWWGSGGDVRNGLIPTVYNCVYSMTSNPLNLDPTPGRQGERHNGAVSFQIIKSTTPASVLELNVAGKPEYGWRVKQNASWTNYVIAEYSVYWHHPTNGCYTNANTTWSQTAPTDVGGLIATPITPVSGSTDPTGGTFTATSNVASIVSTTVGNITTTVTTYIDGTHMTETMTVNANGTITKNTVNPNGSTTISNTLDPAGSIRSGGDEKRLQARTGRISWHEIFAP